jgi:hypothetical protein
MKVKRNVILALLAVIARSEATRQSSGPRNPLWIAALRSQ